MLNQFASKQGRLTCARGQVGSRLSVANMVGHLWQQQRRLVAELRVKLTNYFGKYLRDFDDNNVATPPPPPLPLISFGFSFSNSLIWFCRLRLLRLCSRVPAKCVCAAVHMYGCVYAAVCVCVSAETMLLEWAWQRSN